eukprot:g6915.t1
MLSSARASALLLLRVGGAPLGARRDAQLAAVTARHYVAPALLSVLAEYGERHGHVRVPQRFVVPNGDGWAARARGVYLGRLVNRLREKHNKGTMPAVDAAQLDALGFVWSVPEWQWQRVLQSLAVYKEMHGDLEVPQLFVVPAEVPWREDAWGLKLGNRVDDIRSKGAFVKDHPGRRAELHAMGFRWRRTRT